MKKRDARGRRVIDVLRMNNNLAAWLEVKDDFLELGISAERFYASRRDGRDRPESDAEVLRISQQPKRWQAD